MKKACHLPDNIKERKDMKLKEYILKIKNRLTGKQQEDIDSLSKNIVERTKEMIEEDRQEVIRAAYVSDFDIIQEIEQKASAAKIHEVLKPTLDQVNKTLERLSSQLQKAKISNNRHRMRKEPMLRIKAIQKAVKNEKRNLKKQKEGE